MANSHSPSRWETGARPWEAGKQAAGCKIAWEAMAAATNGSSSAGPGTWELGALGWEGAPCMLPTCPPLSLSYRGL